MATHVGLIDAEQERLIQFNVTSHAKNAVDIFEIEDYDDPKILAQLWQTLDDQREELSRVRADEEYMAWKTAHHKHGESMNTWITHLKKMKLELKAPDTEMVLSRRM